MADHTTDPVEPSAAVFAAAESIKSAMVVLNTLKHDADDRREKFDMADVAYLVRMQHKNSFALDDFLALADALRR